MKSPNSLENLVVALDLISDKQKRETIEILAALCLVTTDAHRTIYNYVAPRFDTVILHFIKNATVEIPLKVREHFTFQSEGPVE